MSEQDVTRRAAEMAADEQYPETVFAPENERFAEVFVEGALWQAAQPGKHPDREQIDGMAAAIAEADDAHYWIEEIADWEGTEDWDREAHPDNYPSSAYEDRERYRRQARAAVLALAPEPRDEPTKQLATYVHDIKLAKHIVIDDNVTIDGFVLPWWVTQDMAIADLTGEPEGSALGLQTVTLAFFVDRVTVDEEKVAELGTTITRIPFAREAREESEADEPDPSLDDCPACDAALSDCSPNEACCEDCAHTANWPAPEVPELEREKARAWDSLAQHPIFAGSEALAHIQALAMWRKLDSLVGTPAPEAREVTDAEVEAAARVINPTGDWRTPEEVRTEEEERFSGQLHIQGVRDQIEWIVRDRDEVQGRTRTKARAALEAAREVSRGS